MLNIETRDKALIIVNIRMEALTGKRKEFLRAIEGISGITRKAKGCLSQHIWQNIEDENQFEVFEVWKLQEDLDAHWRSDIFGALLGTEHLLRVSPQIFVNVVSHTAGMEAVTAARRKSPL